MFFNGLKIELKSELPQFYKLHQMWYNNSIRQTLNMPVISWLPNGLNPANSTAKSSANFFIKIQKMGGSVMDQYLTPRQLADHLSVSAETLLRWRKEKAQELPFTKVGAQVRYKKSDVDAFLEASRKDVV